MELLREKPGRETRLLAIWQIRMREMAVHTKEIIIQALLELLNERPLFRITVKDIVERCKVNRNTFYYHFRDIPDVVEYVMKRELDRIFGTSVEMDSLLEGFSVIVDLLGENKKAMLNIYRSVERETFARYLGEICSYTIDQYAERVTETEDIPEETVRLLKHFNKCIFVGVFLDWLEHGMEYDLLAYAERLKDIYGDSLESALTSAKRVEKKEK